MMEKGGKVTFSKWCMSGYFGDKCNCSRCRTERGLPVTDETESLSKVQSIVYRQTGGIRDTILSAMAEFPEKRNQAELCGHIYGRILKHLESGHFKNYATSQDNDDDKY